MQWSLVGTLQNAWLRARVNGSPSHGSTLDPVVRACEAQAYAFFNRSCNQPRPRQPIVFCWAPGLEQAIFPFFARMNVTGPALLTANDLALAYGHQRLLEAVTLLVAPGEKVGLLGRNGSGKTSLLRILAGHQSADAGEVARRQVETKKRQMLNA
jgi:ABC-type glutathione transport system ATPase component